MVLLAVEEVFTHELSANPILEKSLYMNRRPVQFWKKHLHGSSGKSNYGRMVTARDIEVFVVSALDAHLYLTVWDWPAAHSRSHCSLLPLDSRQRENHLAHLRQLRIVRVSPNLYRRLSLAYSSPFLY